MTPQTLTQANRVACALGFTPKDVEEIEGWEDDLLMLENNADFVRATTLRFRHDTDYDAFSSWLVRHDALEFATFDLLYWTYREFCVAHRMRAGTPRQLQIAWKLLGGTTKRPHRGPTVYRLHVYTATRMAA